MQHILIILIGLIMWEVSPARAQSNPYKIDDVSYQMYVRASKHRYTPLGLAIADSLYQRGVAQHDGKSQCLALSIPLVHYFVQSNRFDELTEAADRLKKKAREVHLLQYYYYACSNEVNYYINHNMTLRALDLGEAMRKEAFAEDDSYGIFTSVRMMGNINYARRNEELALKYYKEAYEFGVVHCKDQDMSGICNRIVQCCNKLSLFDEALEYARKADELAQTDQARLNTRSQLASIYYNMGKHDDFLRTMGECEEMIRRYGDLGVTSYYRLQIYRHLILGDYPAAYRCADSLNVEEDRLFFRRQIAQEEGNYKEAFLMSHCLGRLRDSLNRVILQSDFAELNARMGTELLRHEAQQMQMENAELNLRNTSLALEKANAKIELDRIDRENRELEMQNRELEVSNLKATSERQKLLLREQELQAAHTHSMTRNTYAAILVVVLFLLIYSVSRYRSERALRRKNRELEEAREVAEQADRMKTVFLQNMSHEIRTPLNAIVGFSQVLSDESYGISPEEKADLQQRIAHNSDLLTTLVNDILDLSGLESGKYTMEMKPTACNTVCRNAVHTVQHRCPKGVDLVFTTEVDDSYMLVTDGKRLQQVLINFLTNAEKNTVEGKIRLHSSLTENPGELTFSVTDTGPGVPADKQDVIFERFHKLDNFKQGTGLGLNICQVIAERLGGRVYLDRTYTQGARFVFAVRINETSIK